MDKKTDGQPVEPGTPKSRYPRQLVDSAHGKPTVIIKGVLITGEKQQNQQDGEPPRQAGDDLQTTAQQI